MNGLDRLLAHHPVPLKGTIGYLGHQASVDQHGVHAVTLLARRPELRLKRLFAPEHGFAGTGAAGEFIGPDIHPESGLPIFSLYGRHRTPPMEWLEDLDAMVVDLQDLGVRCYTYASTLQNVMRACAEIGLPLWVLDRATPNHGIVDGPNLDPGLRSFVGQVDTPLVYGTGQGPLAEKLKRSDASLDGLELRVLSADPVESGPWIPPSPAIVSRASALTYPMTVWCEAIPGVWVDRGGACSFQVWSMPGLPAEALADTLRPAGAAYAVTRCATSNGEQPGLAIRIVDRPGFQPVRNAVELLCGLRDHLGKERLFEAPGARPEFFDQLMGTRSVREGIEAGRGVEEICADWPRCRRI